MIRKLEVENQELINDNSQVTNQLQEIVEVVSKENKNTQTDYAIATLETYTCTDQTLEEDNEKRIIEEELRNMQEKTKELKDNINELTNRNEVLEEYHEENVQKSDQTKQELLKQQEHFDIKISMLQNEIERLQNVNKAILEMQHKEDISKLDQEAVFAADSDYGDAECKEHALVCKYNENENTHDEDKGQIPTTSSMNSKK